MQVLHSPKVRDYLTKHQLENQFRKAMVHIAENRFNSVDLKLLKPKQKGIWQFRISKKYRALAVKEEDRLYVFRVSDHQ